MNVEASLEVAEVWTWAAEICKIHHDKLNEQNFAVLDGQHFFCF